MKQFVNVMIIHVPIIKNEEANDLAQVASGYKLLIQIGEHQNMIALVDLQIEIIDEWYD